MKTLYLCLALIFSGSFIHAQQSELLGHTWNLEKVTLNNVEHYFPKSINTISATANFTSAYFNSHICNTLTADLSTISSDLVVFNGSGLTLGSCPNSNNNEYNIFEGYYFGQFFGSNNTSGIYSSFNYQIENVNGSLKLTLINPNGDNAIYWSETLSVNDSTSNNFKVFPNPVKDQLFIEGKEKNFSIVLTDMQGRQIISKNKIKSNGSFALDLSNLGKGIYLLKIIGEGEKVLQISKVIKE